MNCFVCLTVVINIAVFVTVPVEGSSSLLGFDAHSNRISNGTEVDLGEFPFVATIKWMGFPMCGASVVSPKYVLTQAWCIPFEAPNNTAIAVGCTKLNSVLCKHYQIEDIVPHPDYDGTVARNDIVLVSSVVPIEMNDFVQTVPVSNGFVATGTVATFIGNGVELLWVTVEVVECTSAGFDETHMCTAPSVRYNTADLGSPLIVEGALVGFPVTSLLAYDVHQRVSVYADWIAEVIAV